MGATLNICQTHALDTQSEQTIQELDFQGNFERLEDRIKLPPISQQLSDLLSVKKPFLKELNSINYPKRINYRGNVYIGVVSQFRSPYGWGKMYCKNGDVIVGQFQGGQIKGKCFHAKPDGAYYQGDVVNGKLSCEFGAYYSKEFQYLGGFKENEYHGKGKIIKNDYILEGEFVEGNIQFGKLQWKQNDQTYIYTGQFNQNIEMHGKGVLEETCGTYRGEFKNNKKEGDGSFKYLNGNVFRGYYISGRKKGFGELFSPFNEIIYRGEWANDVPQNNHEAVASFPTVQRKKQRSRLNRVESLRCTKTDSSISSQLII